MTTAPMLQMNDKQQRRADALTDEQLWDLAYAGWRLIEHEGGGVESCAKELRGVIAAWPVEQPAPSEPCAHDYVRADHTCTECGERVPATTVAWMHAGDPRDCISDAKKRDMIKHAGAPGARLAENYSIPLGRLGTPPTMAAAESAEERAAFEAWWYDIDEFQYGETDSAWAAWKARAAASPAAEAAPFKISAKAAEEWAVRHFLDHVLKNTSTQRAAIEDARTLHLIDAPQPAQADAPDDDRGPSGDHYRCTRCGATIAAGGKLTCERGPCPMELVEQSTQAPDGIEPPRHIVDAAMDIARYEYGHGVTRASIVAIWKALGRPWNAPAAGPAATRCCRPYQWRDTGALETGDA
ncbi:hypothetical protein [Burkholderia multivorans]|uniref:hypothetical protein n=1 Tax=Burkholderia multivorans TaxID=87883 RepID=UPI0021BFE893|nr:hypothetical protein [Burkholderia multivorans]